MFHRMMNYGELEAKPTVVLTIDVIKRMLPKFKRHDDLIIVQEQAWVEFKKALPLPVCSDENSPFSIDEDELASLVCQAIQKPACRRLAIERRVKSDGYRRPTVRLILGKDGMVKHKDNHILYQFDVTKCMFSFGNIREKMRMAALDCSEEVVVDLFAGIGYFTLPLLVHSKAKHLYACDWNPDAIEALRENLVLNKIKTDRYTVIEGDNRINRPVNVAQRVILGILPSCIEFMKTALDCVDKETGAILHCHDLVDTRIELREENVKDEDCWTKINTRNALDSAIPPVATSTDANNHSFPSQKLATNSATTQSTIEKLSATLADLNSQTSVRLKENASAGTTTHCLRTTNDSNELIGTQQNDKLNGDGHHKLDSENNHNCTAKSSKHCHEANSNEGHLTDENHSIDDELSAQSTDEDVMNAFQARAQILSERIKDDLESYKLSSKLMKIQLVKSYAPHVYHVVFDIKVEPVTDK